MQELNANDHQLRLNFCHWALAQLDQNPNFFWETLFGDEATFNSTGSLNRHNSHYYSLVNPHWHREVLNQHRWSLYVWVGICNGQIIGPHFFENTVNADSYLDLLNNYLPQYLEDVPFNVRARLWFQQDGAPAHYVHIIRQFLNHRYQNRWIGRAGPVLWPPRSPDLNPLDFYFWGYAKNAVFSEAPTTLEDMKVRIRAA